MACGPVLVIGPFAFVCYSETTGKGHPVSICGPTARLPNQNCYDKTQSGANLRLRINPEIAISDIGLPGFDGFEVARRLRGRFGRGPLLVALTGYGRDEDRRLSREAGFDHHLVKPADPVVLRRVLAAAR